MRRANSFENPEKKRPVDADSGPQAMPQLVEMERVMDYLDQGGFLKNRSQSAMPARVPDLQRRFDEAWFYARLRKAASKAGSLPADLEHEAVELAARSWPVSLMLARYYARSRDVSRANAIANQFAALVSAETDSSRLAHYRGDVRGMATRIARACEPETAKRLAAIVADCFPGSSPGEEVSYD
jgi:hypothetical protein